MTIIIGLLEHDKLIYDMDKVFRVEDFDNLGLGDIVSLWIWIL